MADLKLTALTALGLLGGCIAELLGGWDTGLQSLFLFMAIDYITGLIVAGVFKKSRKSQKGALESLAAWKGLLRKGEAGRAGRVDGLVAGLLATDERSPQDWQLV